MRVCTYCGQEKPLDQFPLSHRWRRHTCKACRALRWPASRAEAARALDAYWPTHMARPRMVLAPIRRVLVA